MKTKIGPNGEDLEKGERGKKAVLAINYSLLIILIVSMSANQFFLSAANEKLGIKYEVGSIAGAFSGGKNNKLAVLSGSNKELTGDLSKDTVALVLSSGAPEIYGSELNVTFDQVQQAMNVMREFDPNDLRGGGKKIIPQGDDLKRYIDITTKISCEYCCGAKAITFADGKAACGCAHAKAMRGLAAYLIKNHGSEYTNDQVLRELSRWKGMYFPKQMIKKVSDQIQSGKYTPDIAALILDIKLPEYVKGGASAPLPSEIENLPGMVGGC